MYFAAQWKVTELTRGPPSLWQLCHLSQWLKDVAINDKQKGNINSQTYFFFLRFKNKVSDSFFMAYGDVKGNKSSPLHTSFGALLDSKSTKRVSLKLKYRDKLEN